VGFVSQLIASAVGGGVGGSFVLWGLNVQFRRQSEAALRAVVVEVNGNVKAALQMFENRGKAYPAGHANPGWLKHSIWDSQLTYLVQLLDQPTLTKMVHAYGTLEVVPSMRVMTVTGVAREIYDSGGWVDTKLDEIRFAFLDAQQALEDFQRRIAARPINRIRSRLARVLT
jgi:hypothetical protein